MSRAGLRGAALPRSWLLRNLPGRGNHDCLHWLQLLIKPPSVQLAPQEEHSLPHSVSQLLFFMFIGIRWFVERSTPRHAHPVRSAEETTAATCCPSLWELQAVATISPGHAPPSCPPPHPPAPSTSPLSLLQPHACPNCCLSTQTRTFCCQQKHTWRWRCHPTPCRQHTPTCCLPLSKLCSITLPGSCQHGCSRCLEPGPPSPTCSL